MDSSCQDTAIQLKNAPIPSKKDGLNTNNDPNKDESGLSKNQLRKQRKYMKKLEYRKLKRAKEKETRKNKQAGSIKRVGNDEKSAITQKLQEALKTGPKVVIDCQYGEQMSLKEQNRFTQQLRRAYASNKSATIPLHLYFASLPKSGQFFKLCCQKNSGFENYVVDIRPENVLQIFSTEDIVYLSPDSPNVLTEFDPTKVYVIGGLVDETTTKNSSLEFCTRNQVTSARLPIDEYFEKSTEGTFKKILTVNQMIDIIIEWFATRDWHKAIAAGLPQRTGFVPKKVEN